METFKIEGVVLRTTNFGDANRVVTIFTKEHGKLELNAYGCRRAKSPMSGALQMFNRITAEVSRGSKVYTIREADVAEFYGGLTTDVERIGYASILFEIVNRMMLPKFPDERIYELLVRSLPAFDKRPARVASIIGVCQFMECTGEQLNYFECVRCGAEIFGDAKLSLRDGGAICNECANFSDLDYPENLRRAFAKMLAFDWQEETHLTLSGRQIEAAEKILWRYAQEILGRELNSLKFVRQIQNLHKN